MCVGLKEMGSFICGTFLMEEIAHAVTRNSLFVPKEAADWLTASLSVPHFFPLHSVIFQIDVDILLAPNTSFMQQIDKNYSWSKTD